jgi:pyrroline-5-carboxylate reductase
MTLPLIAIIGTGNMGESLLSGLIASGHSPDKIYACDPNEERLQTIRDKLGIHTSHDNLVAIENASIVLFAVKPQQLKEVMQSVRSLILSNQPLVISIAAGVLTSTIRSWLKGDVPIVRAMPNLPALIQTGATALYADETVDSAKRNIAESVLRSVGITVWVHNGAQMDVVTALSGSGPAYFFYMMDALEEAGIALGLAPEAARLLTIQTAFGATRLALESPETLKTLRLQVTSKGGTTEEGIRVLEAANLRSIMKDTVLAASNRAKELAAQLDEGE